jgi:hypothetical protein
MSPMVVASPSTPLSRQAQQFLGSYRVSAIFEGIIRKVATQRAMIDHGEYRVTQEGLTGQ